MGAVKAFVKMTVDKSVKKREKRVRCFSHSLKIRSIYKRIHMFVLCSPLFLKTHIFPHFQWISLLLYTADFQRFNYVFLLSTHMVG